MPRVQITVDRAIVICTARSYQGKARRSGTIKSIYQDNGPAKPWTPCWRNQDAAALQPYAVTGQYIV
jgi:hypothetical protein